MSYVLRHNLTGVALQDLLTLFNAHFPGLVPATTYLFHKAYGQFGQYKPHFYCINCETYIGPSETAPQNCSSCNTEFDIENSLKLGSYFLVLSLSAQIVDILEKPDIHLNTKESTPGILSDIQCGAEYQKFKQTGQMGDDDISILWNCDGIPVFKSNNVQIWPIQCQIVELSPRVRQGNICIPCLWLGNSKPNMATFLTAFVAQLKELEQVGIKWRDSENTEHTSKIHSLLCSSDSIARPLLRNTKQFNGKYGCDFCLHSGGGPYVWETPEPPLRTETDHFRHAMLATPERPIMGVKGPSPLMELESFKMITGFVPDYQHCVCLGVTKQLTSLWLDSKHHKEEWYLGSKVSDIDQGLMLISPPVEVTRAPRSVKDRKFWKASEWRSFLLFYALTVLSGILKKKYWSHLFLLVFAIHTLLQDAVKMTHVDMAEQALRKFVHNFEKLYGAGNVSFNVHLLMHLASSVRNWGPLWATSTFPFESFNGTLLKIFNGTTHVSAQIVKRFLRWRGLSTKAETIMENANDNIKKIFGKLQGRSGVTKTSKEFPDNVRGFGCPKKGSTSVLQRRAIEHFTGDTVHLGLFYDRFICNSVVYHSYNNTTLKKRNNSVVQLNDGTFCEILTLVAYTSEDGASSVFDTNSFCLLVKELAKSGRKVYRDAQLNISCTFLTEVCHTNNVFAVHPQSLERKCVMVKSKDKMYVSPLPNNVERD
ncbi:uncharacterized protein LOC127957875 [Carassius gibelio]|uniref:uncharacterized protein LOC127957875 n=1 Tax=Carassius gibelio TaxID=101364 RepID=UPI0022775F95|nr:uncharacterized protein LOC127957875 [Carassius gibelio]